MEDGKVACKSDDITATPIRKALPTSGKQQSKREQELPKIPRSAMKNDLTAYFGKGKRSPGPTTAGNPITTVIQRRELQIGTPTGKGDSGAGTGGKKYNNNSWRTPLVKKKRDKSNATPQGVEDEEGQNNKKPRSDDEESAGEQSKGTEQAGHTVDLESMSASMRKKSPKTKILKSKKSKEKWEDSAKKPNQTPRKKATFAPEESEESGKKKEEGEVAVNFQCVIRFAIRVDKGNNTKGGFDKKLSEGLTVLREFVDPAACILPNGKDKWLGPIKLKSDLPKYQLTTRNYFNIPNQMVFSNVNQDNGRVIKGSAIMGFSMNPKNFVIFSVEYLYYPFGGTSSTDRFLSLVCIVPQCSGYARFELQVDNIPHREEDTIYCNGILFEVQYCPDIVQGLLANYEVVHRCRSSCFVFYYVGGQMD
jgi:hypothetical protein